MEASSDVHPRPASSVGSLQSGPRATIAVMDRSFAADPAFDRIDRMLRGEPVIWLSSVRPDGAPHLVPIWFSWDGDTILVASKPHARKVANLRHNPSVMLALGEPEDDFDVGMIEGVAELPAEPARDVLPEAHLAKYRDRMAEIGLGREEFLATYSQVVRIRPTRFLPWHGRAPGRTDVMRSIDRRVAAAIRRVAAGSRPRNAVPLPA
jgi:PPOX class probable F420-dependent enzyme